MKNSALNEIKEVEKEAENLKKNAQTEALAILADAREQAEKFISESNKEARLKAAALIAGVEVKTAAAIAENKRDVIKECDAIRETALKKSEGTARFVLGRIIS